MFRGNLPSAICCKVQQQEVLNTRIKAFSIIPVADNPLVFEIKVAVYPYPQKLWIQQHGIAANRPNFLTHNIDELECQISTLLEHSLFQGLIENIARTETEIVMLTGVHGFAPLLYLFMEMLLVSGTDSKFHSPLKKTLSQFLNKSEYDLSVKELEQFVHFLMGGSVEQSFSRFTEWVLKNPNHFTPLLKELPLRHKLALVELVQNELNVLSESEIDSCELACLNNALDFQLVAPQSWSLIGECFREEPEPKGVFSDGTAYYTADDCDSDEEAFQAQVSVPFLVAPWQSQNAQSMPDYVRSPGGGASILGLASPLYDSASSEGLMGIKCHFRFEIQDDGALYPHLLTEVVWNAIEEESIESIGNQGHRENMGSDTLTADEEAKIDTSLYQPTDESEEEYTRFSILNEISITADSHPNGCLDNEGTASVSSIFRFSEPLLNCETETSVKSCCCLPWFK